MLAYQTLAVLWSMLQLRRRAVFCLLIALLFLSGLFEMGGMMVIFGFISGLKQNDQGERHGPTARLLNIILEGPIPQTQYVVLAGAGVVLFIIVKNLFAALVQFGLARFLMKVNQKISRRLFEGYLIAPYPMIKSRGVERIQKHIGKSFATFSDSFSALAQILADGATLAMVTVLLLFVDPTLTTTAMLIFGGVGSGLYWAMQRLIKTLSKNADDASKETERLLTDALGGIVDTRLRFAHRFFSQRYSKALNRRALYSRRLTGMRRLPRATNEILLTVMIVGSVLYLTLSQQSIEAALPTLALFGFAGMRLTGAMTRLNTSVQALRQNASSFDGFVHLIHQRAPDLFGEEDRDGEESYLVKDQNRGALDNPEEFRELTFTQIAFGYGKKSLVVHDIDLTIKRGEFVSFCGPSGGGKSTILLLLMGLLPPKRGAVMWNGKHVRQSVSQWQHMLGYVGQDLFLTEGSLRENIAFAEPENKIQDERVWRALRLAAADTFVAEWPEGLNRRLNGGRELSGGQKQRLVIARALYRDPQILILDEATAALDNVTERAIAESVRKLSANKTVICVAHRLSTIKESDVIYFVDGGTITASGSYEELLSNHPPFREMVRATGAHSAPA